MYLPPDEILTNYAKVMVDFALGKGKGINPKNTVYIQYDDEAKPLALKVYQRVLEKGAYPISISVEEQFEKVKLTYGNDEQIKFFPKKFYKSLIDTIDHRLYILAPRDPFILKGVDPQKIVLANYGRGLMKKWIFAKEDKNKLTWSLCLYGTPKLAKEAGLSINEFWEQIIRACFLDNENPVSTWQKVFKDIERLKEKLNSLKIDKIRMISKDTDITIKMGDKRVWRGGSGANIPSFEIFTSPDWRGAEGKIFFNHPLYRYGNIIKDIFLEFKGGRIIQAKAAKNENLLKEMIKQKNADKIGEFSLTDKNFSRINKFMANTLYDENYGGDWGNSHIAIGSSYSDCYEGDKTKMKKSDWANLGFNDSPEHCDIINTNPKEVVATLKNGVVKTIYKDGTFII